MFYISWDSYVFGPAAGHSRALMRLTVQRLASPFSGGSLPDWPVADCLVVFAHRVIGTPGISAPERIVVEPQGGKCKLFPAAV